MCTVSLSLSKPPSLPPSPSLCPCLSGPPSPSLSLSLSPCSLSGASSFAVFRLSNISRKMYLLLSKKNKKIQSNGGVENEYKKPSPRTKQSKTTRQFYAHFGPVPIWSRATMPRVSTGVQKKSTPPLCARRGGRGVRSSCQDGTSVTLFPLCVLHALRGEKTLRRVFIDIPP